MQLDLTRGPCGFGSRPRKCPGQRQCSSTTWTGRYQISFMTRREFWHQCSLSQIRVAAPLPSKAPEQGPLAPPEEKYSLMVGNNVCDAHAITRADFTENPGLNLDRIVQDRTGLTGAYTFKLTYPPTSDDVSEWSLPIVPGGIRGSAVHRP